MNENDIIEKLNEFKNNFSFVTDDSKKLDSLVSLSINDTLKKVSIDDPIFYKNVMATLKTYIKRLINYEYQRNRDELFKRAVSLLLTSKNIDILRRTEVFSAFVKAIDDQIEEDFFKKVLSDNSKIEGYINAILVTDGKTVFVDPDLEDYCNQFKLLIDLYIENMNPSHQYIKRADNSKHLSRVEVIELFRRIKSGDEEAVSILIENNTALVKKVVSRYSGSNIDFDDLYQEGLMGLLKAIEGYDVSRGFAFSTYAVYWIRQYINRYIHDNKRSIRIPVNVYEKMNRMIKMIEVLEKEEGRTLSIDEIAEKLNISVDLIKEYYEYLTPVDSINRKVTTDSESSEIGYFLKDDKDSYQEIFDTVVIDKFLDVLRSVVNKRSFDIFCRRNGFLGYEEQTLEEIGVVYGLTRERIRQIESKVYKKIKTHYLFRRMFEINANEKPNTVAEIKTSKAEKSVVLESTVQDFVTYFKEKYGIEDIEMLLSCLSKTDIDCLKRRYGESLSEVKEPSNRTIADANYIVFYKIPKLFNLETSAVSDKMEFASNDNLVRRLILIKPYLIGLRDSLNSMIGIIDNHCEERNKCKVKRIESSE